MTPLHDAPTAPACAAHVAIELQDQLLCAATELDRLQRLLGDAALALLRHFGDADAALRLQPPAVTDAAAALAQATQALQFQDLAAQLLAYTQQRVQHCAERLAGVADSDDADDTAAPAHAAPQRPNPVVQDEMDSGLIELF